MTLLVVATDVGRILLAAATVPGLALNQGLCCRTAASEDGVKL